MSASSTCARLPGGITVEDVAKRLIDYGFHAPTMSFPVAGTFMIEPTESESLAELDAFCDALIAVRAEVDKVASGEWDAADNPLKNAPHTAEMLIAGEWSARLPEGRRRLPGRPRVAWPCERPGQVLAPGPPHRPGLRRPPPGMRLPAPGGLRVTAFPALASGAPGIPALCLVARSSRPGPRRYTGGDPGLPAASPA